MSKKRNDPKTFSQKILELESVFGQKETAKRLGVSPKTLQNYKTGKTVPKKEKAQKLNRVYGKNKEKVSEEKLEKYTKKIEKKREVRKQYLKSKPRLISSVKWSKSQFKDAEFIQFAVTEQSEYVAITEGRTGQFVSPSDILDSRYGLPKGTKFVTIIGVYTNQYEEQGNANYGDLFESRFPILLRKEMDLEQALDYLEGKFFETSQQKGKLKFMPTTFVGYKLQ